VLLVALICAWSYAVVGHSARRGRASIALVWADVAVEGFALPLLAILAEARERLPVELWATGADLSASALAGAVLGLWTQSLATMTLAIGYVAVLSRYLGFDTSFVHVMEIAWTGVLAALGARWLRWYAHHLYGQHRGTVDSVAQYAAENARVGERARQFRLLHDTTLNTLTAIARGSVDPRSEAVRTRCAREADYLRSLIQTGEFVQGPLADELRDAVGVAVQCGLRVHLLCGELCTVKDPDVVKAFCQAAGEALNNVARHSGQAEAWVSAVDDGEVVSVRIVDRGRGFRPSADGFGFGLRSSILERMRDVGASASITSVPGQGTCVELVWPA
jgi:signal transduction histidine kinase